MPFPFVFEDVIWKVVLTATGIIATLTIYFLRDRIRKWWFCRRIKPTLKQVVSIYKEKILPEFVETEPKLKAFLKKEDIPPQLAFGYIFIPVGQEEQLWDILLTYLPVSCSMKRIKVLFDESLRKSMFNLLSYELGIELEQESLALMFRDRGLSTHPEDFETMEKVYNDGKLTAIILQEASIRFRKAKGKISTSDVQEFSTVVRKMAKIDAAVLRIGGGHIHHTLKLPLRRNVE